MCAGPLPESYCGLCSACSCLDLATQPHGPLWRPWGFWRSSRELTRDPCSLQRLSLPPAQSRDHKCKGNHPPLPFPPPHLLSAGSHHPGSDPLPYPSLTSCCPISLLRRKTPDPRFSAPPQLRPQRPCTTSDPGKSKRCRSGHKAAVGTECVCGGGGQDAGVGGVGGARPLPFPLGPLSAQSYPSFRRSWSSLAPGLGLYHVSW